VSSRILFIGSLNDNSNSYLRYRALCQLSLDVFGLDIDKFIYNSITKKVDHHFNFGIGTLKLNWKVAQYDFTKCDLVLIDNRPFLFSIIYLKMKLKNPNLKIAILLTDDPGGSYKSGWRLLKSTAMHIDRHFVQRSVNIQELYSWGANSVNICYRSFDPLLHRKKVEISKTEIFDIGFIGTYESSRAESIKFLIDNGIKVQIIGDGWENSIFFDQLKQFYMGPSVYGEEYVDYINSMKIALHFLRKGNRDEQDSRTFEIPACGTPMIAEYSDVHGRLFREDLEVLFFKNNEELLEKVRFFIERPEVAAEFAIRAQHRCIVDGYDHKSRLKYVLTTLEVV
jgi:spore maturation protein CgeB